MNRLLWLFALLPTLAAAQVKWDFEDGKLTWRPRSAGVKVELTTDAKTPHGKTALHVSGRQEEGWNYAISDTHPMTVGQAYRLSLWMCVADLPDGTQAPCVKCEFVPADGQGQIGRVTTEPYDTRKLGEWQKLTLEFRAPERTGSFWLAIEKGGNTPMAIDLFLDEVLVKPIKELTIIEKYALDPLPKPLQEGKGVHPRLYLDAAAVVKLREAVKTTHAAQWQKLQAFADRHVKSGPPAYTERDKYSGDEQLWQREVGNAMPTLALAWLITQDRQYLDSARAWALASCGYATWGLGRIDGMDLATGHQLFGLGLVYDWCYADLGDEARKTIRDTLQKRAGRMYEAAAAGTAWWGKSYLQNHLWVNVCGMAVAGLAVYDELPEATRWIGLPLDKFQRTMQVLGPDGASHEGVGYWQYGVEYMLKFMALARELLERDLYGGEWWKNTAYYALYLQLPRAAWTSRNNIVDLADCPRGNWYGPEYMLWHLARAFNNPYAQWQAQAEFAANITAGGAPWLNLLWYDPAIVARPPDDLPTLRHFEDMGIVSARTDWSGNESLLVYKCGPFLGHEAVKKLSYDAGGGHVHPDASHFLLFGDGEWLIRDDGYASKWTGQHNTLLVDGQGQTGEGQHWFNGGVTLRQREQATILKAESSPEVDHIVGDARPAYPDKLGLGRYVRHLIFLKPNVLIVLDDIECDPPRALELRFHPEQQEAQQTGNAFVCKGKTAVLRVEPLTLDGVQLSGEIVKGENRSGGELPMFTVRLQTQKNRWRNATAFTWSAADQEPVPVTLQVDGDEWFFIANTKSVGFDWSKQEIIIPKG